MKTPGPPRSSRNRLALDLRLLRKLASKTGANHAELLKASRLKPETFRAAIKRLMFAGMVNRRLLPAGSRYASSFSVTEKGLQAIKSASGAPFAWSPGEPLPEWRIQRRVGGWLEAYCSHGVGHSFGIHGCDWCCRAPNFPGKHLKADRMHAPPGSQANYRLQNAVEQYAAGKVSLTKASTWAGLTRREMRAVLVQKGAIMTDGAKVKTPGQARRLAVEKQLKALKAMQFKPVKPSGNILREIRDE